MKTIGKVPSGLVKLFAEIQKHVADSAIDYLVVGATARALELVHGLAYRACPEFFSTNTGAVMEFSNMVLSGSGDSNFPTKYQSQGGFKHEFVRYLDIQQKHA